MKGLIVSDTHGWTREVQAVKDQYKGTVDFMIHCGDSELKPDQKEMEGFIAVEGNCDLPGAYPNEAVKVIGGTTFLVAHGHLLGVRQSPARLCYRAQEAGAQIACFGHTHFAGTFQQQGMIVINPGSLRLPRNYREGTYVLLDLDPEKNHVQVSYFTLDGTLVDEFTKTFSLSRN
ncbi:metallophosphoesterase family protein [Sporolactobacillus inulinus]|uniref:Phosphoesterase n=1 Tax=Sporolactobacillus inulinus CASD TaxID=1069536 RepID=A0A0U1QNX3_9BACL|nr:metallophosphoesterase [Sporolactobacillus inulinus]KLI02326.1 phosphodiesterase [Sporolactobacillus inulinus CASD]